MEEQEVDTVSSDFKKGITNYRVLAKKHNKTMKQIASYLRNN